MIRGNRVLTRLTKTELITPRMDNVTKSPRKDAIGGAILSGDVLLDEEERDKK